MMLNEATMAVPKPTLGSVLKRVYLTMALRLGIG